MQARLNLVCFFIVGNFSERNLTKEKGLDISEFLFLQICNYHILRLDFLCEIVSKMYIYRILFLKSVTLVLFVKINFILVENKVYYGGKNNYM